MCTSSAAAGHQKQMMRSVGSVSGLRQGQTLKPSCGSTGISALETCLQPPEYLCAATGGPLRVKLPEGISLTSFFILHPQSWNGCHRTNNPRFHLNIGVEMKPSPRATLPLCTQGVVKSNAPPVWLPAGFCPQQSMDAGCTRMPEWKENTHTHGLCCDITEQGCTVELRNK